MKTRCPNLRVHAGYSVELDEYCEAYMCDLVDKWCLVEQGNECGTYEGFLKGEANEKLSNSKS